MIEAPSSNAAQGVALRQQLQAGFDCLRRGEVREAQSIRSQLLAVAGGNAEVQYLAAEICLAAGDVGTGLNHLDAAIAAAPGEPLLLLKKANLLVAQRRRDDAREIASAVADMAAGDVQLLWAVGNIYGKCGDPRAAKMFYEQACRSDGGNPALRYDLALTQFFTGDADGAARNLETAIAAAPKMGHALYLRSILRRQSPESHHIKDLEKRLEHGFDDDAARAACLYALAKELEDLGQHDRSFQALTEGSAIKRRSLQYDVRAEVDVIDAIRAAYTAEVVATGSAGHAGNGPIFIVGMPRTGTTLVERMLSCHSDVGTAGELMDFGQALAASVRRRLAAHPGSSMVDASLAVDFTELGHDYLRGARQAAPDRPMFIDKMPVNFLYCGLIHKALPAARIIHLVRDPMDSCYAIYKTLFHQAYHFSYDLQELADYYAAYYRLMRHWHSVMPGAILDVRYEELVTDTEEQARRMLAWCGLDWQSAVLAPSENSMPSTTASAAQVRGPVNARSVQKWRIYETGLAPLKSRLEAEKIV